MAFPEMISGLLPLFIIIILLAGALFFVKKYAFKFRKKTGSGIHIKTIATQMIAPKKYISVVSVQNKLLVVGVSENSISLLKELDNEEETETFVSTVKNEIARKPVKTTPVNPEQDFASILKKNLGIA